MSNAALERRDDYDVITPIERLINGTHSAVFNKLYARAKLFKKELHTLRGNKGWILKELYKSSDDLSLEMEMNLRSFTNSLALSAMQNFLFKIDAILEGEIVKFENDSIEKSQYLVNQ